MSCYYCGRGLTDSGGTMKTRDHVVAITHGGVNYKTNIVICCQDCNALKGSLTLEQLIRKVERAIRREKRVVAYSRIQLKRIVINSKSLIENCINVYQKQLFIDKYHWESYQDKKNKKYNETQPQ